MNTKRMVIVLGVISILFLGGCVVTPYHGSVGYSSGYYGGSAYYGGGAGYYGRSPGYSYRYGNRPAIRSNIFFGGGHRHIQRGHSYRGHRHHGGGQGHFRGHGGGHRG